MTEQGIAVSPSPELETAVLLLSAGSVSWQEVHDHNLKDRSLKISIP